MNVFTGWSRAPFASLLPVFSAISQATQPQRYAEGVRSGTRRRKPGGGTTGTWPTMAEQRLCVRYYDKTYPTFEVLGTPLARGRSKAHEHLQKRSPIFDDPLVP